MPRSTNAAVQTRIAQLITAGQNNYKRPQLQLITAWLAPGRSITSLTDYLVKYFDRHPLDWVSGGRHRREIRRKPLFVWRKETRQDDGSSYFADDGTHYHILVASDAQTSGPRFLAWVMLRAQRAGIIREKLERGLPFKVTGLHDLSTEEGQAGALKHGAYIAKEEQQGLDQTGRSYGCSRNLASLSEASAPMHREVKCA
jgi:hypothetical protein